MKKRMSLAEVVPEMLPVPPVKGGAVETLVYDLAMELKRKYDVTVVSRPSGSKRKDGIRYIYIPESRIDRALYALKKNSSRKNPIRHLAKAQNVYFYAMRAAKAMGNRFDVIHVHNDPNMIPLIRKYNPESIILLHMHNDHLVDSRMLRGRYSGILGMVDLVLCVSDYIRNRIVAEYPQADAKCITLHNGVDVKRFRDYGAASDSKVRSELGIGKSKMVLYTGRLIPEKGVHILIKAMKRLLKKFPDSKLVICGSSWFGDESKTPYIRELEQLSMEIKNNVIFTGYIPQEKLARIYSAADLFVCPSIWPEPFALVCLEALASCTKTVMTRVGGITESVPRDYPYIAEPGSPQSLAKKMIAALSQKSSSNGAYRARVVKYYSKEAFARKTDIVLRNARRIRK